MKKLITGNKILIVDDQSDVAESIGKLLIKRGFEVQLVSNGLDCIEKMRSNEFRLVFLDVMLRGMSGEEVARTLRNEYGDSVVIVYVTIKHKGEIDMASADGYLQKPFSISSLLDHARNAFANKGGEKNA